MHRTFKHIIFFLSINYALFLFQSCSYEQINNPEPPKNLIAETKMKQIMSEMMLLETTVQSQNPDLNLAKNKIRYLGNKLLSSYGVDSSSYIQSFNYYSNNQEKLQEMYTEIIEDYNVQLSKSN